MLHLHTAGDLAALAASLGEVLSATPSDPMEQDLVAVPSSGMRTWLALQLAEHLGAGPDGGDGVSANIDYPFPGALRRLVLEAGAADGRSPWELERLVWAILEVTDDRAGPADPVPRVLSDPPIGSSRYATARRIADLFDRYHVQRPSMIEAWVLGNDIDGVGSELAAHHRWQPALWRAVRELLGVPSPPELLSSQLAALQSGELLVDLPDRVCVFGMSLLPGGPGFIDLAASLGVRREVHLFVVEPSALLRARFAASDARPPAPGSQRLRSEMEPASALRHPLLRSWGRLHYETASVLADAMGSGVFDDVSSTPAEVRPVGGPEDTLLSRLQDGIRNDTRPTADLVPVGDAAGVVDDSVEFHACHGPTRQVEVLRDTLLRLLCDHPHLQEDDILVVCPELESMAPMVEATFGASARTGSTVADPSRVSLRYRLADRSLGTSVPLVSALTALLDLLSGRFGAPAVLDFIALEPVRYRLGFSDEDLATVTQWAMDSHVRWGLDPEARVDHGVPAVISTNTWQAGTERLLLGSAIEATLPGARLPSEAVGDVLAISIEGSDVSTAGRLGDLLWRLGELAEAVSSDHPLSDWIELIANAVEDLFDLPREDLWQLDRLRRTLGEIAESATHVGTEGDRTPSGRQRDSASPTPLSLLDVRRLLAERLGGIEGRPALLPRRCHHQLSHTVAMGPAQGDRNARHGRPGARSRLERRRRSHPHHPPRGRLRPTKRTSTVDARDHSECHRAPHRDPRRARCTHEPGGAPSRAGGRAA